MLAHRELGEQVAVLERAGDAEAHTAAGAELINAAAVEVHLAPSGALQARQHVEERGLARAVGAHQAHHRARIHGEAHAVECRDPTEADDHTPSFEDRTGRNRGAATGRLRHRATPASVGAGRGLTRPPNRRTLWPIDASTPRGSRASRMAASPKAAGVSSR